MENDGFNGSTVSFGGSIAQLRGIGYNQEAPEVSVHGSSWAAQSVRSGIPKNSVSVDVVGTFSSTIGTSGALTVAWNDGSSGGTLTNAVLVGRSMTGSMNGEITSTAKFVET